MGIASFAELGCSELRTYFVRHFDGQKQTIKKPILKSLLYYRSYSLACLLLRITLEVKMKKKKLLLWSLFLVVLASEGCATIRGMGEDIQSIGRAVKRSVSGG